MPMQNTETVNLPLDQIRIPPKEKMPRKITGVDPKVIERYAELMRDGYKGFPPIEVWQKVSHNDEKQWWIVSGIHRYKAALTAGKESFPCKTLDFPEQEFLLRAYVANLKHGVRYKRDENRLVVQQLYQEGLTIKEISNNTKIPERTLRRWVKPFADEKRGEREIRVRELRDQGLTQEEIAKQLNASQRWVSEILQWISITQYTQKKKDIPNSQTDPVMGTTGPPGHIPQGENSGTNRVIPTETIEKIKPTARNDWEDPQADPSPVEPIKGEKRPKRRRQLKKPPIEEIKLVNRDTEIVRGWLADVKKGVYDNATKRTFQACSKKIIVTCNQLQLAIRMSFDGVEPETVPKATGISEEHFSEIKGSIKDFVKRNGRKIQGIAEEDLEMECWLDALEAQETWDPTKSNFKTWIKNNLEWHFKDLAKKEYARKKTIAGYRAHVQQSRAGNYPGGGRASR